MINMGLIVGGIIIIQYMGLGYWYVHRRFIKPFLFYKLVIFDNDDEFTFFKKKKYAVVIKDIKGFKLFKEGEFYGIPMKDDGTKSLSKRDNNGTVTYYYYRNNPNPMNIKNHDKIDLSNNAGLIADVMQTKILNSSLLLDKKPFRINWWLIGGIFLIAVVVIFHQQIANFLGI